MASKAGPPLDEIQWRGPAPQGIHSNSVLWYFAESPFFDPTSNNAVIINQGLSNINMQHVLFTREAFEGHLRSMSGLEFIVAQEPAEMGPGMGTGVWVIRKQTRRKRPGQVEDEITVHATYFIVGENIYMAPTLADIMSARIATMSNAISKAFTAAESIQKWSPGRGRTYQAPAPTAAAKARAFTSKEATPLPDSIAKPPTAASQKTASTAPDARLAEESLMIHLKYGGDYMDENPITGKPGEFLLSSSGRKDKLPAPGTAGKPPGPLAGSKDSKPLPSLNTKVSDVKGGKETKSPRTPNMPKPKRRKSKGGTTTPS